MRFLGIGNDIVEVKRIEKAIESQKFKERVYTEQELVVMEKKGSRSESYAGRFCAKEAISKALGTGVRNFNLTDIEILNNELGKPYVNFSGNLLEIAKNYMVEISISHCREYATAVAIIFSKEE